MAFNKEINKTVEIGAYSIEFLDDAKVCSIKYGVYETDKPTQKYKKVNISFDEIAEKDLEGFKTVMGYIQTLCDDYNPQNPDNIEV